MKLSQTPITELLFVLVIVGLLSCEEHTEPDKPYFPLEPHQQWQYQRWLSQGTDDASGQLFDTITLIVQNEITMEGKVYREIVDKNGLVDKVVRVEGSKYFARNHELYQLDNFSHEYIFLDIDKAVGESWSYIKNDGYSKTEYIIQAKNATHIIQGIEYKDVIEVKVNYYTQANTDEIEHRGTVIHYYAKGIGEIYYSYPYPLSMLYGDVRGYIINNK